MNLRVRDRQRQASTGSGTRPTTRRCCSSPDTHRRIRQGRVDKTGWVTNPATGVLLRELKRRGIFASVPELIASIEDYLAAHNADPTPYVWTATAESILAKPRSTDELGRLSVP